jgi:HSP20 family protein
MEDRDRVLVKFEMPGLKKEDFKVLLSGQNLTITGERKVETEEKSAEIYRTERYFGHFHRSVPLPATVDARKVKAHYKNGILTIICPKTEEAKRKELEIMVD